MEGRLAREWVQLLQAECQRHLDAGQTVRLDLADVTGVDHKGVALLQVMERSEIEILNAPLHIRALLEQGKP
jgi:ABC-type transporter Mla MlaB component